jgi:hypothetical protein
MRYPDLACYSLIAVGVVFLALGLWRLSASNSSGEAEVGKDSKTFKVANINPIMLVVPGIIFFGFGLLGIVGSTYPPAGRLLTDALPWVAEDIDSPVGADLHDYSLGKLVGSGSRSKYTIRLSEDAQNLKVTGTYSAKCNADLIDMVCRDESKRLTCRIDTAMKIIRVCSTVNKSKCDDLTL